MLMSIEHAMSVISYLTEENEELKEEITKLNDIIGKLYDDIDELYNEISIWKEDCCDY